MFCRRCGFNLGEEKGFCPECGTRIEQQDSKLLTFPYNVQSSIKKHQQLQQWGGGKDLDLNSDKSKVIIGTLGVIALLSIAIGTSFMVMSMLMASEGKKGVDIGYNYFEDEESERVKENYKKVIDLDVDSSCTYVEVKGSD